jgi:hypothetical protein
MPSPLAWTVTASAVMMTAAAATMPGDGAASRGLLGLDRIEHASVDASGSSYSESLSRSVGRSRILGRGLMARGYSNVNVDVTESSGNEGEVRCSTKAVSQATAESQSTELCVHTTSFLSAIGP